MKQKDQLTIRMLRSLVLLMLTMLAPIGAWAQTDYGLTVAGVTVTSDNASNVLDDQETPTVVFNAAARTLTLNGAEINGKITYSGTSNLTIAFSGTCSITTEETSAIQYTGSESDRPKLTFSSTNGTLTINGESIEGFSDVDFGSLNLASNAPGVYYDDSDYFMAGSAGINPSDLTITTETYYPIWIYDPESDYGHTQLRGASEIETGEGTVSFDGDNTITISNVNFNYEGNTLIVVGPSMTELTVNLVGQSTATSGCTVLSLWDTTPLTFTTDASTPGSLTGYDIVLWNNSGNGQISYENGLGLFYDVENSYKKTISTTGTYLKIGNTLITGTTQTVEGYTGVSFDADTNTLTLNNANITVESGDAIVSCLDNLTIFLVGDQNVITSGNNFAFNKTSAIDEAIINFTTDATSNGSLTIGGYLFGEGVTPAYTYVSLKNEDTDYKTIDSSCGLRVGGVDVTEFNKSDVFGDRTVSFKQAVPATDTTPAVPAILTLNGATIEPEEETAGIEYDNEEDLTIALIGNNSVQGGAGCSAITHYNEDVGLSFAKGDETQHFSLTLTADSENGLIDGLTPDYGDFFVYDDVDDGTYTKTIRSSAKPSIWIGSVEVDADGTFPEYDNVSFNSETSTLTLNGISYDGEITSGLNALTIEVTGTNAVGKIVSLNPDATLTFEKASAEAAASLSLNTSQMPSATSVISGFASVSYGNMYLSSSAPYQYDTTEKLLVNATAEETEELTSATVTSVPHYPLWITGIQATAGDIQGEEFQSGESTFYTITGGVTFTAGTTNVLALDDATITVCPYDQVHCHPAIISNLDNLTIQLSGDMNKINFQGDYSNFMVSSLNSSAVLTFKALEENALLSANISTSACIGEPGDGFSSIVYSDNLLYFAHGTSTQYIKNLNAPYIGIDDMLLNLGTYDSSADGMESLVIKYSVDYADESKEDITAATFSAETELTIDKPCTITAHAEFGGKTSSVKTAKYFGFAEPMQVEYAGTAVELPELPALAPAVAEADGVTYDIGDVSESEAVIFDPQTEKYMVQGYGTAVLDINPMQGDNTPYEILNEVIQLTVNVVPMAPEISPNSGMVQSGQIIELSVPEAITGASIYYTWGDDTTTGTLYNAENPITVQTGTLKAWTVVNDFVGQIPTSYKSDIAEAQYTFFSDATAEYTIGGNDNPALPTLNNGNELNVTYSSSNTAVATINEETGVVTPVGVGQTTITAVSAATDEETSYVLTVKKELEDESITVTVADAIYTGEAVTPAVTVMDGDTDILEYVNVAYSDNTDVGTGTVTITPKETQAAPNYYVGLTTATFTIDFNTLAANDVTFHNHWATYYNSDEALNLPNGIGAYIATNVGTSTVTVTQISYIPKGEAVLLNNATTTTTDNTSVEGNLLRHADNAVNADTFEGLIYGLYNGKMMRVSGTIPAGKNYLVAWEAAAPELNFVFNFEGNTTGVSQIENGELTIDNVYDLSGRKLSGKPSKKGLYIQNGKKVVVNNK